MNSTTYTLYLTRSTTLAGMISSQQFARFEDAKAFATAYATKWVIRQGDVVLAQGSRN